jgi:hypothetical protein
MGLSEVFGKLFMNHSMTKLEQQILEAWGYGTYSEITLNNARIAAKIARELAYEAYEQGASDSAAITKGMEEYHLKSLYKTMTKAELEQILTTSLKDIHFMRSDQTYEGVLNCMVEAYNRAIDDSVEYLDDNPEYDIQAVYKLKI